MNISQNGLPVNVESEHQSNKPLHSPLKSASSLPNLLSNESVYESPTLSPTQYRDFVPSCSKMSAVNTQDAASALEPSSISSVSPVSLENGGNGEVSPIPSKTSQFYTNVIQKSKVGRLQSDPLSSRCPEYTEPIAPDKRARFYSYRGMKLPNVGHKLGVLKVPIPLPDESSDPTSPNSLIVLENSYTSGSSNSVDQLESTLENIEEVEENDIVARRDPKPYLEPVKSKQNKKS